MRFGILVAILVASFASGCGADACENAMLQDLPSPDGRHHAIIFTRSCGATTGVSTQVSIVPSVRDAYGGGNVFIADTDHGRAPSGPSGGPVIAARWIDSHTVEIRYHPAARIFRRATRHDDTDIRYAADST